MFHDYLELTYHQNAEFTPAQQHRYEFREEARLLRATARKPEKGDRRAIGRIPSYFATLGNIIHFS
jgi:hypothetical protein